MGDELLLGRGVVPVSLDAEQLRELVIAPVLEHLGMHSTAAEELVLNTARAESQLEFLRQHGGGPALGLYQMEPATHDDIWENFLKYRRELSRKVRSLAINRGTPDSQQVIGNLYYATAMCRVHYFRVPAPLPSAGDLAAQADYWKRYYNTHLGRGTVEHFLGSARTIMA